MKAEDLTVVIPTRDRWPVLARTLDALSAQTAPGFETIVVVDGTDQTPPPLPGAATVVKERAGPGAARNAGVAASRRPVVLFLGDDMVPTPGLVAGHLDAHCRHPGAEVAVLGRIDWHPEARGGRLMSWLGWSDTQFELPPAATPDAGFGRFYSSNVSLGRELFVAAGGFDEDFAFDYEDLDCGWRLAQRGMRLVYEPAALVHHLHRYDWPALEQRFRTRAVGERVMAAKHPWFEPHFARRVHHAEGQRPVSRAWPAVVDCVPPGWRPLRRFAEERAERWYYRRLARPFLDAWEGERDREELRAYLGDAYEHERLVHHRAEVEREEAAVGDEGRFYRTSEAYLYDLTAFAMSGTKSPYLADLRRVVHPGSRVLDYGCGIGSDGLRLLDAGYRVAFADFDNPSTRYLRWRLARRGLAAEVYDLDAGVPAGFDAAYAFDVLEHVDDPFAFLAELERRASVVAVNLLEPDPGDPHLHRPLPIPAILDRATRRGLLRYRIYHGRSHLLIYRGGPEARRPVAAVASRLERQVGQWRRGVTSPPS